MSEQPVFELAHIVGLDGSICSECGAELRTGQSQPWPPGSVVIRYGGPGATWRSASRRPDCTSVVREREATAARAYVEDRLQARRRGPSEFSRAARTAASAHRSFEDRQREKADRVARDEKEQARLGLS
jgi:hypothetical protein